MVERSGKYWLTASVMTLQDEYLGIGENDAVEYLKGSVAGDGTISVVDSAVWTIISTDTKVVRFVEPASHARLAFAPAPGVLEINVCMIRALEKGGNLLSLLLVVPVLLLVCSVG